MAWTNVTPLPATPVEVMAVADMQATTLPASTTKFAQVVYDAFSGDAVAVSLTSAGGLLLVSAVSTLWASDDGVVAAATAYTLRLWYSAPTSTARLALYPAGSDTAITDSGAVTQPGTTKVYNWQKQSSPAYLSTVTLTGTQDFPDPTPPVELINPRKHLRRGISVDVVRAAVTVGTLHGVGFDPGTSVDVITDQNPERVVSAPSLLAVYGSGVLPQDQIVVDDVLYEVDGHPKKYRNPFSGRQHGEIITLKLVEG